MSVGVSEGGEHLGGGEAGDGMAPCGGEFGEGAQEEVALLKVPVGDLERRGVVGAPVGSHDVDVDLAVVVGAVPAAVTSV